MIYSGFLVCILVVLTLGDSLTHIVSLRVWPCVFLGLALVVVVLGLIAYNFIPKRLILPIGIIGWLVSFSILCWMLWFGPLALGHTSLGW